MHGFDLRIMNDTPPSMLSLYRVLTLMLVLLLAGPVLAVRAQGALEHVAWSAAAGETSVAPGGELRVVVTARIDDGWKMYAMDSPPPSRGVRIDFGDLPEGIALRGAVRQDEPKEGYDPNFQKDVRYFEQEARFEAVLGVEPSAAPGARQVRGTVQFMICNDRMCMPPTRAPFEVGFRVAASAAGAAAVPSGPAAPGTEAQETAAAADSAAAGRAAAPGGAAPEGTAGEGAAVPERTVAPEVQDLEAARAGGVWGFLLLAIGAGLAALLTPCVFPMIPLTVSFFTRHAGERGQALRMAGVYGLAIVLTFTGLGVLTALLVGAAGAQTIAANPWINLFIGLIFIVFALSLLGLFELRLPNGLVNYFNRQSNERHGYIGVLFMGLTLTLVSFSCTAPFVGGLLAATVHGQWAYPVLGMLVFSTTFSLPFIFFALFPQALHALPRSGAWMSAVKVVLGFVELAAALKFLSNADLIWGWNLISRPLAIASTVVIFFLAGLYLLGKLRLAHEPPLEQVTVPRLLVAIAFFALSLYMMPGLLGAPLNKLDAYLPPRQGTDISLLAAFPQGGSTSLRDEFAWHTDDIEGAFAAAAGEGKPVLIDFTGYTCTNCREMEANVFTRPEVAERFRRDFVLLRLYTDDLANGEIFQRYQLRMTGTVALPTYAIVDPAGEKLIARITGMTPAPEFLAFLERGRTSFLQRSLALR